MPIFYTFVIFSACYCLLGTSLRFPFKTFGVSSSFRSRNYFRALNTNDDVDIEWKESVSLKGEIDQAKHGGYREEDFLEDDNYRDNNELEPYVTDDDDLRFSFLLVGSTDSDSMVLARKDAWLHHCQWVRRNTLSKNLQVHNFINLPLRTLYY